MARLVRRSLGEGGRAASYGAAVLHTFLMLDEQSSQAQNVLHTFVCLTRLRRARHKVLHKSLTMKHCFRLHFITPRQAISFSYEAFASLI